MFACLGRRGGGTSPAGVLSGVRSRGAFSFFLCRLTSRRLFVCQRHVLEKNGGVNDRFMIKCQECPSSFLGLEKGSTQYDEEVRVPSQAHSHHSSLSLTIVERGPDHPYFYWAPGSSTDLIDASRALP
jgi:hypothetical protein